MRQRAFTSTLAGFQNQEEHAANEARDAGDEEDEKDEVINFDD